jgi:hypothetical protein
MWSRGNFDVGAHVHSQTESGCLRYKAQNNKFLCTKIEIIAVPAVHFKLIYKKRSAELPLQGLEGQNYTVTNTHHQCLIEREF